MSAGEITITDIDKAIASVPEPKTFADYGKVYEILPSGGLRELCTGMNKNCKNSPTADLHPCSYDSDLHNDQTPKCRCCEECQALCADEL